MKFRYYLIDEDGDVLGTDDKAVADAASCQGCEVLDAREGRLDGGLVDEADPDEFLEQEEDPAEEGEDD